jgi:hypothetical protein
MSIDRKAINIALAKVCAYQQCGKQDQAEQWARELVTRLECSGILLPDATQARESDLGHQAPDSRSQPVPVGTEGSDGYCPHGKPINRRLTTCPECPTPLDAKSVRQILLWAGPPDL